LRRPASASLALYVRLSAGLEARGLRHECDGDPSPAQACSAAQATEFARSLALVSQDASSAYSVGVNLQDILQRIEMTWAELASFISGHDPAQLMRAPAGQWSAKDHLAHVTAWERHLLAAVLGQPANRAMGVELDEDYVPDTDELNEMVFLEFQESPLGEVLFALETTHIELVETLAGLSEEDLDRQFMLDRATDQRSLRDGIAEDSYDHYPEHVEAMRQLLSGG
jgi:hypothetical protein